jgi:hypothetical protein
MRTPPDNAVKTARTDYMYYNVLIECPKIDFNGGCWVSGSGERQKGAPRPDFISLILRKGGFLKSHENQKSGDRK